MNRIFFMSTLLLLSVCGNVNQSNANEVYSIRADYSTSDSAPQDFSRVFGHLKAFSDADCENELILEECIPDENGITWQFAADAAAEAVYLIPPVISVADKVEETVLGFQDENNMDFEEFLIEDMSVEQGTDSYKVTITITSKTGQYPDNVKMVCSGRRFGGRLSVSMDVDKATVTKYSYQFEASTNVTSESEIIDEAYFVYSDISHYQVADEWDFSCEDIALQIVNTTLD